MYKYFSVHFVTLLLSKMEYLQYNNAAEKKKKKLENPDQIQKLFQQKH